MFKTPSRLTEDARFKIADALNASLADGLDLHGQIKVAHWNIKGPQFPSLHPLFETFAIALANFNDAIAERAVTLGGKAYGTSRHVAKVSRIADIETYLDGVRASRHVAEKLADTDTVDLLTGVVSEFEKNAWFLRASLEA